MISASLSVFDLNGPVFLGVYIAGFFFTLVWTLKRRSSAERKLSLSGTNEVILTDSYEIAYLAGGIPRCAEVAMVKLVTACTVYLDRTGFFKERRLISNGPAHANFHTLERALHSSISSYGSKGMPIPQISELLATKLSGIESKLARLGLRPTASELNSLKWSIMLPMLLWVAFGLVKLFVGISRDKPIGFLVILIFITFATAAIIASLSNKLTPNGEKLLKKMRSSREYEDNALHSVALFGAASIVSHYIPGLDPMLLREISQTGRRTSQSASSGCSSGGSSGCSSGCGGGCGGCGGD